jgi:MYXO-CTERM domain-containing protein
MSKGRTVRSFILWLLAVAPASAASLDVGSATGSPGETVDVRATLNQMGSEIAGIETRILFDRRAAIIDCRITPDFAGITSRCLLGPEGCTPGQNCDFVKCVVTNVRDRILPFPDGAVLYTCSVRIACDAPEGDYALALEDVIGSTGDGIRVPTDGNDGTVTVSGEACPEPTPTSTPGATDDDDGGGGGGCSCQLGPTAPGPWVLLFLLLPLVFLAFGRRAGKRSTDRGITGGAG